MLVVDTIKKRKRLLVAALCTLAILLGTVLAWLSAPNANDPVYGGRRLSSWLQKYPLLSPQPVDPPEGIRLMSVEEKELFYRKHFGKEVAEGHRVLMAVGGDALPLLVELLGKRERLQRWRSRARFAIARYIPIGPGIFNLVREQAITALLDLQNGGCDLGTVMPEIERLTKDSDGEVSAAATFLVEMLARNETIRKSADPAANALATASLSDGAIQKPTPEPSAEAKIVLQKAEEVETRRKSFGYTFVVKEKLRGELPDELSVRLYQGSDVDDRGRDSHVRLAEFFLMKPSTNRVTIGEGRPLLAQNTNAVNLKVFGTVWLLQDENGKAVAVDVGTTGQEWASKGIIEQFGAGKGK
jgi:hypothetical protein